LNELAINPEQIRSRQQSRLVAAYKQGILLKFYLYDALLVIEFASSWGE
jgi:hypothetical protein